MTAIRHRLPSQLGSDWDRLKLKRLSGAQTKELSPCFPEANSSRTSDNARLPPQQYQPFSVSAKHSKPDFAPTKSRLLRLCAIKHPTPGWLGLHGSKIGPRGCSAACIKAHIDEHAAELEDRTSVGARSDLSGRQIKPYGCKSLKFDGKLFQHRATAPDSHAHLSSGTPPTLLPRRRDVGLSFPRIRSVSWVS